MLNMYVIKYKKQLLYQHCNLIVNASVFKNHNSSIRLYTRLGQCIATHQY